MSKSTPLDEYWEPLIGQKVCCLGNSSASENGDVFVKGKTYEVDGVVKCTCGKILITVTSHQAGIFIDTNICHIPMPIYCGKPLGNTKYFAPLQSYPDATKEILALYPIREQREVDTDVIEVVNN